MGRGMSRIGFFDSLRLRWFIHKHQQPLRNRLSEEGRFCCVDFAIVQECAVFPDVVIATVDVKMVDKFINLFPEIYVHKGVLEWADDSTTDIQGTPGIYIKDVFGALPDSVYLGYCHDTHGQLLFIPMYINVESDEQGRVIITNLPY